MSGTQSNSKLGREQRRQAIADTRVIKASSDAGSGGTRLDLRINWYAQDAINGGGSIHAPGPRDRRPTFKDTDALLDELREIIELARPRLIQIGQPDEPDS